MKQFFLITFLSVICTVGFSQGSHEIVFPDSVGWNVLNENQPIAFKLKTTNDRRPVFTIEGLDFGMTFDTLGSFAWKPSFDLVDRVQKTREVSVIFQATWPDGKRVRRPVTFTVNHVNRAPVVEELPVFYVKQSTQNNYQISSDYAYDPDGDPLVFKPVLAKMPEGASLNSQGLFTWTASRNQFLNLKKEPVVLEFIVQDQPDKAETIGKLRTAQTQQDLPPDIQIIPSVDSLITIKEDETLNLKLYITDPNGDDNVKSTSFISTDKRVAPASLKENTPLQYEFTWMPGYNFVQEVQKQIIVEITFFSLDKTNNRAEKKIRIKVLDAENMIEKDEHQYKKYRDNLVDAVILISELDANQKKLNVDYRKAKRGKKNRSIVNATFGATSGFSPIIFEPDQAKVVGGVGGTTVLTLGTLEATEVIGKSRQDILDKIKTGIEIRNKIQASGDDFSRRFALKSARRTPDFEKEIDKLRASMNDQRLVLLELDAEDKGNKRAKISNRDIKKFFLDFSEE